MGWGGLRDHPDTHIRTPKGHQGAQGLPRYPCRDILGTQGGSGTTQTPKGHRGAQGPPRHPCRDTQGTWGELGTPQAPMGQGDSGTTQAPVQGHRGTGGAQGPPRHPRHRGSRGPSERRRGDPPPGSTRTPERGHPQVQGLRDHRDPTWEHPGAKGTWGPPCGGHARNVGAWGLRDPPSSGTLRGDPTHPRT